MASPSGANSSASTLLQISSASEADQIRKQKRMKSNRESARRSRMRAQKRLHDLRWQVQRLREENRGVSASLSLATQQYLDMEAENSVLMTRMVELSSRLLSLNEILHCLSGSSGLLCDYFHNPWNLVCMNQLSMASADMFQY